MAKNVIGTMLQITGTEPITGYYRDGYCSTGADDRGAHVIAAVVTEEFLQFSKVLGNDLVTPIPAYGFVGLKANEKYQIGIYNLNGVLMFANQNTNEIDISTLELGYYILNIEFEGGKIIRKIVKN